MCTWALQADTAHSHGTKGASFHGQSKHSQSHFTEEETRAQRAPCSLARGMVGVAARPQLSGSLPLHQGRPHGHLNQGYSGLPASPPPREILWRRAQHPQRLQTAAWTAPALRRWRWLFLSRRSGSSQLSAARHPQVSVGGGGTLADPGVKDRVNTIQVDCLGGSS